MTRNAICGAILTLALTASVAAAFQQDPQQEQLPPVISQDRPVENAPAYTQTCGRTPCLRPADRDLRGDSRDEIPGALEDELVLRDAGEQPVPRATLEPLEAGAGIYLPPGRKSEGTSAASSPPASRVAHASGSPLTKFVLALAPFRSSPKSPAFPATIASVRNGPHREGAIEGRTTTQQSAAEAAAAGAGSGR